MHESVRIALGEVGYMEKNNAQMLDDQTANAGDENYTKYARDLDIRLGFYRGYKQGLPWCDVFVDWCFVQAYGTHMARMLLCQPMFSRGAGCRYSYGYYEQAGRIFHEPQPGDQIFFRNSERIIHTGLVVDIADGKVHTVEGNTDDGHGIIANGGKVCRKTYDIDNPAIAGYGRPDYARAEK